MTATEEQSSTHGSIATPLMTLSNVSQAFHTKAGAIKAVDDITLSINPGEVLCLVGESGSGKTTAARMAAGLAHPSGGEIAFGGKDIWSMDKTEFSAFRRSVQYIHQDPYASLNPTKSVQTMLTAPLQVHHLVKGKREAAARAAELLTQVDLTPPEQYLSKFPHQLSGGQRQRAAVARALTLGPQIMIADEATSMLDVSIRISMLAMLGRLRDDLNVGFLFITHDLAIAKYFGWHGKTAVMYLGRIVEFGPTPQIINSPEHPYTKALIEAIPEPESRPRAGARCGIAAQHGHSQPHGTPERMYLPPSLRCLRRGSVRCHRPAAQPGRPVSDGCLPGCGARPRCRRAGGAQR